MYCRHCGKEISDNAFMCPDCGEPTATGKTPSALPSDNEVRNDHEKHYDPTGLSVVAFLLSLIALVTGIVFGAFFFVYSYSNFLLFILGATTILPAVASVCIGTYVLVANKDAQNQCKAFSITAIVLGGVALLFLFVAGCVIISMIS